MAHVPFAQKVEPGGLVAIHSPHACPWRRPCWNWMAPDYPDFQLGFYPKGQVVLPNSGGFTEEDRGTFLDLLEVSFLEVLSFIFPLIFPYS